VAEAVPGIGEAGEGVVEQRCGGTDAGEAEEAAELALARRTPPESGEGSRADGSLAIGLADMETKADQFDIGADLSQRLRMFIDVAPLGWLTRRFHAPALIRDAGAADRAERVEEDFGAGGHGPSSQLCNNRRVIRRGIHQP